MGPRHHGRGVPARTDGGYFIYIVARGDTLKGLATRFATTVDALLAANKDITNPNVIYEGQRLTVYVTATPPPPPPASGQTYYVQKGDTLRKIAAKFNTTVDAILKVNPNITNQNLIYVGQAITLPVGLSTHIVQKGDTLKSIASRYGLPSVSDRSAAGLNTWARPTRTRFREPNARGAVPSRPGTASTACHARCSSLTHFGPFSRWA